MNCHRHKEIPSWVQNDTAWTMCRGMFEKGMWAQVDQNLSDVSMLEDSMNCEIWSKGDWWIVCEMLLVH